MQNCFSRFRTRRYLLLTMLLVICAFGVSAQNLLLKGVVKDAKGEPIIGATVMVSGDKNGTATDYDGNFSLNVAPDAVLTVSYVGYKTAEVAVNNRTSLTVVLEENSELLEEVVVIGYGTMKKKDLTGAVGSLGAKDMNNSPMANVGQALQGKVAGLQVVDNGKPGDNVSIKIRGIGTINNSDPLIVIDGVPTDLGLSSLNLTDVDRIDVLKDASATAIYGSRGANGVVLVTTKRGQSGKGQLTVNANYAAQNATNVPQMLNAQQYAAYSNDMLSAGNRPTNPLWSDPSSLTSSTNWLDEILQTGSSQNYSLSYSGGNDKSHYYVSGGFWTRKVL